MSAVAFPIPLTIPPAAAMPGQLSLSKGEHAAREFEAELLGSLLESLEKTFVHISGQDTLTGADDYNYIGSHALATELAARGGFGIGGMINAYFDRTKVTTDDRQADTLGPGVSSKVPATPADRTR
jgi:hypothetical protein